jgi:GNAT superfamily N-acetyltransferase
MDVTDRTIPQRLGPQDADDGLTLSDEAGWNQSYDDWIHFLTHGTVFGLRDASRQLIATAALLPYPPAAWISMVLVTKSWRRQGLATRLIETCIGAAKDLGVTPWLDATPAGTTVYEPMGFRPILSLQRFRLQRSPQSLVSGIPHDHTLKMRTELVQRDTDAIGFDRSALLNDFCARSNSRIYARESAVGLVRDGRKARQIGPLFSDQPSHAIALLDDIIRDESGLHIIDIVDSNNEVIRHLADRGWLVERPFRRMRFGTAESPRKPPIAIAGPEFG